MTEKAENPSAFPSFPIRDGCTVWDCEEKGMTLRDYFAAAALTACLNDPTNKKICDSISSQPLLQQPPFETIVAQLAYSYADAMLKAREA